MLEDHLLVCFLKNNMHIYYVILEKILTIQMWILDGILVSLFQEEVVVLMQILGVIWIPYDNDIVDNLGTNFWFRDQIIFCNGIGGQFRYIGIVLDFFS